MRVTYSELQDTIRRALETTGLAPDRAELCARLIAESSRDGVHSHGLNLVPRLIRMIRAGVVDPHAVPTRVSAAGAVERWDGHSGVGALNAHQCMAEAIAIARTHGIGCVALSNTNHWMRGGTYGWQAAEAGAIGICWTNTLANLPPWGATEPRVGNNPLVIAVPRPDGHVVVDMALSQFSYGALAGYRARGETLPVPGGFDADGNMTRDPAAIQASKRPLPIGYWKGSALSIVLDMIAALLSGGNATHQIAVEPEAETALSQVFIAIDAAGFADRRSPSGNRSIADAIVDDLARTTADGESVRYPGQRTLETRRRQLAEGIDVDPQNWHVVSALAS